MLASRGRMSSTMAAGINTTWRWSFSLVLPYGIVSSTSRKMELFLDALLLFLMVAVVSAAPHQIDLAENAATMKRDGELPLAKVDPEIDYQAPYKPEYAVMMQSTWFGEQSAAVNPDTNPDEYTAGRSKTNLESYADIISRINSMHNNGYQSNDPPFERLFEGYLITFIQSGIRYSLNRLKNKVTNLLNLQQSTTIPTTSPSSITTPITSPPTNTIPSTITETTASPSLLETSTSTTVSTTPSSVTSASTTETSTSTQQSTTTDVIIVVDTTTPSTTTLVVDTTTPAVESNTTSTTTTSGVDTTSISTTTLVVDSTTTSTTTTSGVNATLTSTTTFVVDSTTASTTTTSVEDITSPSTTALVVDGSTPSTTTPVLGSTTTSKTSTLEEDITLPSTTTPSAFTTSREDTTFTLTTTPSTTTQVVDSSTPSTTTLLVDSTTISATTNPVVDTTLSSTTSTPGVDTTLSSTTTSSTTTLVVDNSSPSTTTLVQDTTTKSATTTLVEDITSPSTTTPSTTTPSTTTLEVDSTTTSTTTTSGEDITSPSTTTPVVVTTTPSTTTAVVDSTTTSTTPQVVDTTTPSTTTIAVVTTKLSLDTTTTSATTPAVATTTQTSDVTTLLVDTTIPSTSTPAVATTTSTTDTNPSATSTPTVDTTLPSIITPVLVDPTTSSTTASPVNTKPFTIIPAAETTIQSTIYTGVDATTETSTKRCYSELSSNSGWFTSPNYPSDYNNNMDCSWLINATDNIVLTFQSFNTESCCDFVTIRVYNGYATNVSSLLLNISGSIIPSPVISSRNQVLVTFTSDGNKVSSGFNVSYALESETSSTAATTSTLITSSTVAYPDFTRPTNPELILGNCHTILPNDMGTFNSPYYPLNYTNNIKCPWLITASGRITITFHQFRTQSPYDTVTIYDGPRTSNKPILVASGDSIPPPITPNSNEVLIWFITDGSVTDIGFNASYVPAKATEPYYCGENITDVSSGFISSPNFPNSYPANSRCIWILQTAPGTRIQFHFTNFSTGPDDTVQVFNLETCTTPLIRKSGNVSSVCGFVSSGSWLKINFTSRESTSNRYPGFRASFTTDHGCGGTFNGTDQGTIMSPGYNINGTFTYNCEWKLGVNQGQKLNFSMSELTGSAPNMNYLNEGYQLANGQPTSSFFAVSRSSEVSLSMSSPFYGGHCLSACYDSSCTNQVCIDQNSGIKSKWKASYSATTSPTYGCYGSMNTDTKTVSSPGFPTSYKLRSLQCSWKITEPVGKRIQLLFPVPLNLYQYDNLKIDNPPNVLTISGGTIDLKPIEIASHETTLTFFTNRNWMDSSLYTGWSINWNAI